MRNYTTEAQPTALVGPWLEPLLPELIDFRRDLHAHPELSFKEFRTTDRLVERLEAAGLQPKRLDGTGLTVDIGEGPIATALRGDIDALPIIEETGLPFASKNHGVTHACGHDVHTTTMLGIALVLHRMHQETPLRGRVRIIFQPAEETMPGGAHSCIEQGVLEGVPGSLRCTVTRVSTSERSERASVPSPRRRTPSGSSCPAGAATRPART